MTDEISNAEYRAALGSINYNASNFQVFSFIIGITLLFGVTTLVLTLVTLQAEDQKMNKTALFTVSIIDGFFLVLIGFAYINYLRNIGKYIYGRIRPVTSSDTKCPRRPTGTSRVRI
jgi:hypothetical protein